MIASPSTPAVEDVILVIRGHQVMLDADLAILYGVSTKALNQAVKRNKRRFPRDFMFQLTWDEVTVLKPRSMTLQSAAGPLF